MEGWMEAGENMEGMEGIWKEIWKGLEGVCEARQG